MPYDLFWKGEIPAFDRYMGKAQQDTLNDDWKAWLQGLYIQNAIASILSSSKNKSEAKYPEKPYLIKAKEEKEITAEEKNVLLYKRLKNWSAGFQTKEKEPPQ